MMVAKAAEGVAATAQSPPQHFSSSKVAVPHSWLISNNLTQAAARMETSRPVTASQNRC